MGSTYHWHRLYEASSEQWETLKDISERHIRTLLLTRPCLSTLMFIYSIRLANTLKLGYRRVSPSLVDKVSSRGSISRGLGEEMQHREAI